MNQGWIKLHRALMDWEWYDDIITRGIFIHCLLRANHTDTNWRGIELKRGQFVTSLKHLAEENGISVQTLRTHLKRLKSTRELTIKSTNKNSIITVCKYESYQSEKSEANTQTNTQANKQLTSNQQATNIQLTTDKNDKNNKNVNNEKNFFKQKKNELSPDDIEKSLRQFFNENEHIKQRLFANVEKSCGRTLAKNEKHAIAQRITIFANDYVLRPSWDSSEPIETKAIRFTNYIINSIKNGYELTNDNNSGQPSTDQKGFRISKDFEDLLGKIESEQHHRYGYMENDPFDRNSKLNLARINSQQ